ncbi:MAG: hypothetical protein P8Z31_06280 [Gammaproteobacteria bacterium]|jgi:hypothetical protein
MAGAAGLAERCREVLVEKEFRADLFKLVHASGIDGRLVIGAGQRQCEYHRVKTVFNISITRSVSVGRLKPSENQEIARFP